jgi:phenylacetate-CoA ligase
VNARGERVKNGSKGEVVISNLINRGTVLLNYRLGDVASLASDRCSCGRTLPVLAELAGRVEDIIFLPNGEFVHPRAVWGVFKPRHEVLRYQLIQRASERFELRLITIDSATYQRIIGQILADLRDLLGEVVIEPAYYRDLETQATGKFRPVISLCRQRRDADDGQDSEPGKTRSPLMPTPQDAS